MPDTPVDVIRRPGRAASLLHHPLRLEVLRALATPDSATGLARRLRQPRQRLNYHLRELEKEGFIELVEERPRRGVTERIMRASAATYVISPEALGPFAVDPSQVQDRFSWAYLVAIAARTIRDLGILRARADRAKQRLATLTLETEIRFASAASRDAFTAELGEAVSRLAVKYDCPNDPDGRLFRFIVGVYPAITTIDPED
ncbi:MAG: helix-turn-helix domain-containing protein [bacterium]